MIALSFRFSQRAAGCAGGGRTDSTGAMIIFYVMTNKSDITFREIIFADIYKYIYSESSRRAESI